MKFWTYVALAVLCYLYGWSNLATFGITKSTMYIAMSPFGHTVASAMAIITYLVAPSLWALIVWGIGYLIVWLVALPFGGLRSQD